MSSDERKFLVKVVLLGDAEYAETVLLLLLCNIHSFVNCSVYLSETG